jgi:F-type H+-transporting ATPase subunit b
MLIDWFTVAAQMVNFLVLLLLLKWLLFDRIVRAMDEREQKIADRLEDAKRQRQEAEEQSAELDRSREQLESQRQQFLAEAEESAAKRREELTQQARREVDELRERWQEGLEDQQQEIVAEFQREAGRLLEQCIGRALKNLADTELQQATERAFLQRVDRIDEGLRKEFLGADDSGKSRVVVSSADELSPETRKELEEVLSKTFGDDVAIDYEVSAELITGCELRGDGRALGWNLRDYLDSFSESLTDALRKQTHAVSSESSDED